ncbi:MAG: hypothetical protein LBP50_07915 [Tannerella sp.]|jgi:hypothetical protein|nr:hypothetical protein [Tannerella sp.]
MNVNCFFFEVLFVILITGSANSLAAALTAAKNSLRHVSAKEAEYLSLFITL